MKKILRMLRGIFYSLRICFNLLLVTYYFLPYFSNTH
jgi:hypothetical protein